MRLRRYVKILKRDWYSDNQHDKEISYVLRMVRRTYARRARQTDNNTLRKLYVHQLCSPYLLEDIINVYNIDHHIPTKRDIKRYEKLIKEHNNGTDNKRIE